MNEWDQRFSAPDYVYGTTPNAFVVEQAGRLTPGARVLVPADGEGRNGVWLAEQGMRVMSVDGSRVGLEKARRLAATRGVALITECADLTAWEWPEARFDAVVATFLHLPPEGRKAAHAGMVRALRPGGALILEAFRLEQLPLSSGGPKKVEMLYSRDILQADFAGLSIETLTDATVRLNEGTLHQGRGETVRLVARKRG